MSALTWTNPFGCALTTTATEDGADGEVGWSLDELEVSPSQPVARRIATQHHAVSPRRTSRGRMVTPSPSPGRQAPQALDAEFRPPADMTDPVLDHYRMHGL